MFRVVAVAVILLPVLAGCGPATVCPAIMYGATLTVRLTDDWSADAERTVTLGCPPSESCGEFVALPVEVLAQPEMSPLTDSPPLASDEKPGPGPGPGPGPATGPVKDGAAEFSVLGGAERVVVTVRGAGTSAASRTVEPEWVRVGGDEQCGGPMHADVVVPAP